MKITWELPLDANGITGELEDGTPFVVRPIREGDGPALEAAFSRMSARTRYLRFFAIRETLGEAMVARLTEIDHDLHRAWVVSDPTVPSDVGSDEGRGVAVARLVRIADEPHVAEGALAVVDEYQGRGYGRLLLELLVGTARDTGVEFVRFETLRENRGMRSMLANLDVVVNKDKSDTDVLVFDLPVTAELKDDSDAVALGALYEILRWIASDSAPAA